MMFKAFETLFFVRLFQVFLKILPEMQPELLKERREPQRYEAIPGNTSSYSCDKKKTVLLEKYLLFSSWGC